MTAHYADLLHLVAQNMPAQPDMPEETPDSTLRALWHAAVGTQASAELAGTLPLPELDAAHVPILNALLARRLAGEPLAYITGRQRFMALEMLAGPEALVPRKETELLGRTAVAFAHELELGAKAVRVVDVCTGAGNLALAVAHHVHAARVYGADISAPAVALAQRNARHLSLGDRVQFRCGDLLAPFDGADFQGSVDLVTCNPPYISSIRIDQMEKNISAREPRLAFDGGPFGVSILMRLIQDAPRLLRTGGCLMFEVGLGQGPSMMKRLQQSGAFRDIRPLQDAEDATRALAARI